jgi:hypothetical protein
MFEHLPRIAATCNCVQNLAYLLGQIARYPVLSIVLLPNYLATDYHTCRETILTMKVGLAFNTISVHLDEQQS